MTSLTRHHIRSAEDEIRELRLALQQIEVKADEAEVANLLNKSVARRFSDIAEHAQRALQKETVS